MAKRWLRGILLFWLFLMLLNLTVEAAPEVGKKIDKLSFYKADLLAVLQQLGAAGGYNLIIAADVSGLVTLQLHQITYEEAIRLVVKGQGLVLHEEGESFLIKKTSELRVKEKEGSLGYFHLDYAEPKQVLEMVQQLTGLTALVADERTRALLVTASTADLIKLGKIINLLDQKLPQITLEVKIVEISTSALRKLGMNWQNGANSFDWGLTLSGPELILRLITAGYSWEMIFNALASSGEAHLVAAPAVATLNGKEALILIGDKVPVETKDKDGNLTMTYLEVGVKLSFTPWVQKVDEVLLDLKTQFNSLGEKTGSYYLINAREVSSRLQAKFGETVYLGGLISQKERKAFSKIPYLGDLPLLGKLFQRTEKSHEETELILTITPKLNQNPQPQAVEAGK